MEQRSLKILGENRTFFGKITNTLTKLLLPTKVGFNGMLISMKRNNVIKTYENYKQNTEKEGLEKRYEESYTLYLEAIDKYIMDSIYTKVKNGAANEFEKEALTKYYTVTQLKESEYLEYKYRKQKYLLELDYENVLTSGKEKYLERYEEFYVEKMDSFYKGILKNYAIKLADKITSKYEKEETVYNKIFETLEEYITEILPIKIKIDQTAVHEKIVADYEEFSRFEAGKFDAKDKIEKNMVLLGISRNLFTHSLPLVAAEQCYIKLLKDTRNLIVNSRNDVKEKEAYELLIKLIEDYNVKLLSTKVYWDNPNLRELYKTFWKEYQNTKTQQEKEILFISYDLKLLKKSKKDYTQIKKFYIKKLTEYGVMRKLKSTCRTCSGGIKKKNTIESGV